MVEQVALVVNGPARHELEVEPRRLLAQPLREDLGLTGTHVGCDTSQCGACTVGSTARRSSRARSWPSRPTAARSPRSRGSPRRAACTRSRSAFWEKHGLQCGFCTPGMIMAASDLLARNPDPTDDEIRHGIEGNLCRCTGYQNIVAAIREAADPPAGGCRPGRRARLTGGQPDGQRRPRCPDQAGRGSPVHHRQGPLPRRHQARRDDLHERSSAAPTPTPTSARSTPRRGRPCPASSLVLTGADIPYNPLPMAWPAGGVAGIQNNINTPARAGHRQRQVDRRGRGRGDRRDGRPGGRRARGDRRRLGAPAGRGRCREGDPAGCAAAPRERPEQRRLRLDGRRQGRHRRRRSRPPRSSSASGSSTSA